MMFTTKTEYGLRAMAALARNKDNKPVSLAQIAKEEHISQAYLERLFSRLKADNLVDSVKGASGGYFLKKKPKDICVFDIVEALEGAVSLFYCMSGEQAKVGCSRRECLTKKIWHRLQGNIIHTLREYTLADLM